MRKICVQKNIFYCQKLWWILRICCLVLTEEYSYFIHFYKLIDFPLGIYFKKMNKFPLISSEYIYSWNLYTYHYYSPTMKIQIVIRKFSMTISWNKNIRRNFNNCNCIKYLRPSKYHLSIHIIVFIQICANSIITCRVLMILFSQMTSDPTIWNIPWIEHRHLIYWTHFYWILPWWQWRECYN